MDITERKITKIAREAEKLAISSLKEDGVGTAEIDLIHALRHNPGSSQAKLCEILHADKAAIARRVKNLEQKGYLTCENDPKDKRSHILYPTKKAEDLKADKIEIESSFYEYILSSLSKDEQETFSSLLDVIYLASKKESRAGFPNLRKKK